MKNKKNRILVFVGIIGIVLMAAFVVRVTNRTAPASLGTVRLNIETYLAGKNQPTHPSVCTFDEPWNGYRYWMAYSPYPEGNGEEENPCIAASNDLYYWETPETLANPIATNEETECNELKDPHIVYREDLNRLEVWYLGRLAERLGGDGSSLLLIRKYSMDGIVWSDFEIMAETQYLSPSILWDGEKYQMWAIGYDLYDTTGTISYQESADGYHWTEPVLCTVGNKNNAIDIWHGSVTEQDGVYYMSFIDRAKQQEIFFCTSHDGIVFHEPKVVVENNRFWRNLYRPFLWFDGEHYTCIYGVVNAANQWYISMSSGTATDSLQGITDRDGTRMYPLTDRVENTHSILYWLRTVYDAIRYSLRIELLSLAGIEILLMSVCPKLYASKKYFILCQIGNFLLSVYWVMIRMQLSGVFHLLTAMAAVFILDAAIAAFVRCAQLGYHHRS